MWLRSPVLELLMGMFQKGIMPIQFFYNRLPKSEAKVVSVGASFLFLKFVSAF